MSERKVYYLIEAFNKDGEMIVARTTSFLSEARAFKNSMRDEYYLFTPCIPHKVVIKEYTITITINAIEVE